MKINQGAFFIHFFLIEVSAFRVHCFALVDVKSGVLEIGFSRILPLPFQTIFRFGGGSFNSSWDASSLPVL